MWETFVPDLIVAAFGALLTVLIAFCGYRLEVRRRETAAVRSLSEEMHRRRALRPAPRRRIAGSADPDDFDRVALSVSSLRDEVRGTRDALGDDPLLQEPLARMSRACNVYLTSSGRDPAGYHVLLQDLREELGSSLRALTDARRHWRGIYREPGGGTR